MKKTFVKDIMVRLSDYASVSERANLFEAIRALENEHKKYGEKPYRHQSVLVIDATGDVIGKVSQIDIMAALEPKYKRIFTDINLSHFGLSAAFLKATMGQYDLWERPLVELCKAVETVDVTKVMYTFADHQKVNELDTLDTVMHQIVMGRHHSLLVTNEEKIIGILRSTDVFNWLYDKIGDCNL
jgi:CBS domain-containing protein